MSGKCSKCGKGYPDTRLDSYWGDNGPVVFCDPCLIAEMRAQAPQPTPTFASGARYFVDAQGRESEFPSYAN